jgi:hypothetical protein
MEGKGVDNSSIKMNLKGIYFADVDELEPSVSG